MSTVLTKYADFTGRASRPEYWWFVVFQLLLVGGILALAYATSSAAIVAVYYVVALALVLPGLAVTVRRLHDTGRSAWMLLLSLIPIVGAIVFIVFLATAGDSGPNQYGPSPRATAV